MSGASVGSHLVGHGPTSNYHDNQQAADLFGDPIPPPPPTGFVDNYDSELYDPGGMPPNANFLAAPGPSYGMGYTTVPRARSATMDNEPRIASGSYE